MLQAERLSESGDAIGATLKSGEAYAISAQIAWNEGRRSAAQADFREAQKRGWRGAAPWDGAPAPKEEASDSEFASSLQEEPEPLEPPARPRLPKEEIDTWPFVATAPFPHGNASVWHALLGIPAFEQATIMPQGIWRARMWTDVASSNFVDDTQLGVSQWDATLVRQSFEIDYALADTLELGARVSAGELNGTSPIRVFDGLRQIVPTADRGMGPQAFSLRAKFAGDLELADAGVLVEVKFPLADEVDLLTTQTVDLAVVGLVTKAIGRLTLHANAGFVYPMGEPGVFVEGYDEVDPFLTGAVGASLISAPWLSVGAQFEGSSSAFSQVGVLDAPVLTFMSQAHVRLGDRVFMVGSAGHGLNTFSGRWLLGWAVEMTF